MATTETDPTRTSASSATELRRGDGATQPPHVAGLLDEAFRRLWYVPVVVAVIGALVGGAISLARDPVYTASARLAVGTSGANTPQAIGGFAASGPVLAGAYSRAAIANEVVQPIARELGISPAEVRGRVTASSVPETPVIRIDGFGLSAGDAQAVANAAAKGLVAYAGDLNRSSERANDLLRQYREATSERSRAEFRVERAERRVDARSTERARDALREARVDEAAAGLRARTLEGAYQRAQETLGVVNPLQLLEEAAIATNDRASHVRRTGFVGAFAGFVIGSALALLLTTRARRLRPDDRAVAA